MKHLVTNALDCVLGILCVVLVLAAAIAFALICLGGLICWPLLSEKQREKFKYEMEKFPL